MFLTLSQLVHVSLPAVEHVGDNQRSVWSIFHHVQSVSQHQAGAITPPSGLTFPDHTSVFILFSLQIRKFLVIYFTFPCSVIGSLANSTSPDNLQVTVCFFPLNKLYRDELCASCCRWWWETKWSWTRWTPVSRFTLLTTNWPTIQDARRWDTDAQSWRWFWFWRWCWGSILQQKLPVNSSSSLCRWTRWTATPAGRSTCSWCTVTTERKCWKEWVTTLRHSRRSDPIRSDRIRSDQIRSDQIRSDPIRSDQIRSDQIRSDQIRSDQIRSDQIRSDKLYWSWRKFLWQ